MPKPTNINLHQKSKVLELEFDDGSNFQLPCEYLRVYSPSAEVTGHGPGQEAEGRVGQKREQEGRQHRVEDRPELVRLHDDPRGGVLVRQDLHHVAERKPHRGRADDEQVQGILIHCLFRPLLLVHAVFAVEFVHVAGVVEDQQDEDDDRSLLSEPEAQLVAADTDLVEQVEQENAAAVADHEPHEQQPQGDGDETWEHEEDESGEQDDDLQSAEAGQESGDQEGGSDDSQQAEGEAPDESLPSRASGAGGEKEFDPSKAGQDAAAIDWFDQLGSQDEEQGPEGVAEQAADDAEGRGPGGALEQLLDQVEGNPAALLRNQFILEEERLMGAQGGRLYEPRPW